MNRAQRILSRARAKLGIVKYNEAKARRKAGEGGSMIFPDDITVFNYLDRHRDQAAKVQQ